MAQTAVIAKKFKMEKNVRYVFARELYWCNGGVSIKTADWCNGEDVQVLTEDRGIVIEDEYPNNSYQILPQWCIEITEEA